MPLIAGGGQADMTIYGCDVASYQGKPDWAKVHRSGISFAFSKATQGKTYVNPTWTYNRSGMLALGNSFVAGAYHFLEAGTAAEGVAQARHFFANLGGHAGELAIALDVEPSGSSKPSAAVARAWVAEFKHLSGGHPVLGYFPGWWWSQIGSPDLTFLDTLWQSRYVSGGGSVAGLYGHVPSSWWASYGGESVSVLQHTSSATVPGISGAVDGNAYRGTVADLRALALGKKPTPTPAPTPTPSTTEDDMPYGQLSEGKLAITPVALSKGKFKSVGFTCDNGLQKLPAAALRLAVHDAKGWHVQPKLVTVDSTKGQAVVTFADPTTTDGISVRREDAGDVHIAWEVS